MNGLGHVEARRWLDIPLPSPVARWRVFCFPHAGGNSAFYRPLAKAMPANFEMVTMKLPGRLDRWAEPPVEELEKLVDLMGTAFLVENHRSPYVFFGHSMGAIVSFLLARWLRRQAATLPSVLFVSAHRAPHLSTKRDGISRLPNESFLREVARYGGLPPELESNSELLELTLPALRADFAALDSWDFRNEDPLDVPIVALTGKEDANVWPSEVEAWKLHTSSTFRLYEFDGGHFYFRDRLGEIRDILSDHTRGVT